MAEAASESDRKILSSQQTGKLHRGMGRNRRGRAKRVVTGEVVKKTREDKSCDQQDVSGDQTATIVTPTRRESSRQHVPKKMDPDFICSKFFVVF